MQEAIKKSYQNKQNVQDEKDKVTKHHSFTMFNYM